MSTLRTTNIQHASAASANIVLDSSSNAVVGGTLACTGNLTVTSGNVILSNGNGIDFSATSNSSGTMSSELLDDYEEGQFTPTYQSGLTSPSYSYQRGAYTKIGRMVYYQIYIAATGTNAAAQVQIGGLPFAPSSTASNADAGGFFTIGPNLGQQVILYIDRNDTAVYMITEANSAFNGNTGTGISGKGIGIAGVYITA